jgi:DNA repair exonuclease SbcCD nuclease subunit
VRIAIIADPHIDCGVHGRFDVKLGMNSRTKEFLGVLEWIINLVRGKVDGIVIVGDLFDSVHPPLDVIHEARKILQGADIPIWIIGGNHDQPGIHGRTSPNDLVTSEMIHSIRKIQQIRDSPSFIAVPFPIPGEYLSAEEMRLPKDEREALVVERVLNVLRPNGGPDTYIFGHLSVAGAIVGPDQRGAILDYEFPVVALKEIGAKKMFLGHVHPPQVIEEDLIYVGACVVPEFGQEYTPSFVLAKIEEGGECTWTRLEIPEEISKRPKTVRIVSNDPATDCLLDPPLSVEELLNLLGTLAEPDDIVRFYVNCTRALRDATPEARIRQALSKYRKAIVLWEHPEEETVEKVEFNGEIKPEEMVSDWVDSQSLPVEKKERVLNIALEIMRS